jgi:Spy/CpxP family protein refolding chaperone
MTRKIGRILARYGAPALLAAALVASLLAAQEPPQPGRHAGRRPGRARLRAELGLTPEQVQALGLFRQGRREEQRAFRGEMVKLREEMRGFRRDPRADPARMDALIDRSVKLRADRQKQAFRARAERDKIFTPDQLEKIRAFRSGYRAGSMRRGTMVPRHWVRPARGWHRW